MAKVRFAPSPTGYLHIGGARTALFNWMYAKSVGGEFVLRIEDTDRQRSKKEFEDEILESMKWLGLDYDEIYYQSQRFDLYREHAQRLLDEGKAYKEGEAILLRMLPQEIKVYDLIRGEIVFDTANFIVCNDEGVPILDQEGKASLKDEVLIKDDGSPAYNFCCVVDDALMSITHVIRGEDHISNTPRQTVIYQALGIKPPKFAHLPLIMDEGGGRLSKRTGAVAVSDYRKQGFLPEALIN
ncbi:MAG: glutamate--tRNA ligase, partial [Candidatus Omnitrophica bacterium]|nr:glutamate--tRNA ligase [Candidatus Omnitrophota bacterium]